MANKVNISQIEGFLYSIFYGSVSNNTYAGTLPAAIDGSWNDMCLIDCSEMNDYHAYGQGVVLIWLYSKPNADGTKNTSSMNQMEDNLDTVLSNYPCDKYYLSRRNSDQGFDTKIQWHFTVIEVKVTTI